MPTNVSGSNRPGDIDHSPPPPSPAKTPSQAPTVEETEKFNAIVSDPDEDTSTDGGQQDDENSTENVPSTAPPQYGQDFSSHVQNPVVPSYNPTLAGAVQGNPGLQNNRSSSENVDNDRQNNDAESSTSQNSSVQQHNQDNSQQVHGHTGQQNNQGNSSGGEHSHDENKADASDKYAAEMGLSILSSMGAIEALPPAPEADSTGSRETIINLGQELLDKFYTSDSGNKSVYLELKVLDGARVLLTKANGILSIQFNATTDSSTSLLNTMKSGLSDYMEKRLGQPVEVKVKNLSSGDQAGGDGRSKQQRSVLDEYQPGSAP